ncbi:MAG: hypothetical protein HUU35_18920, partial [Armatimonadetes bacterium]|nr:hypothetical protein [Armatimonadota bacterium]
MFRPIMSAILNEFSAERCLADLTRHWLCRSTVPGPAMHRASAQLVERYREHGALAAHLTYPADDRTEFLDGRRLSLEWTPRSASLRIVAPAGEAGLVCRYLDEPLCLVSNSVATPPGGVEAEVIVRRGPLRAEAVTAGEWAGRLLFTDQPPAAVAQAAHLAGAVGIISDCVCPPWLAQHPPLREAADV